MRRTKEQNEAIKKRTKLSEREADPMAADETNEPRKGTSAWFFWAYSQAYARGMSKATGRPFTPPSVPGPQSPLVQTLRAHCKDQNNDLIRGEAVLEWIENVVCDFRLNADDRDYGRGNLAWSPTAFARWLDAGRPSFVMTLPTTAQSRREHITVKKL